MKVFLSNTNPNLTCAILQALKWRITKTKGAYIRREIVISYATYDIIGCKQDKEKVQEALFLKHDRIKEYKIYLLFKIVYINFNLIYLIQKTQIFVETYKCNGF